MPNIGDKTLFKEHLVQIKDLDSLDEEPVLVSWKDGTENVEKKSEDEAMKKCVLAMNGNTLEAEYQCETGRTFMAEWAPIKYGWIAAENVTERDPAIILDDKFKLR